MLQYREFLLQSRANRLSSQFANSHHTHTHNNSHHSPNSRHAAPHQQHLRGSSHKSHESIKQLVSQPNYGEIFYSDSGKKVVKGGQGSKKISKGKEVGKDKKNPNEELSQYLEQLEEENNVLKQRLSQEQRNNVSGYSQFKGKSNKIRKPSRFEQQNNESQQNNYQQGLEFDAQQDPAYIQQNLQNNYKHHHENDKNNQHRYHHHPQNHPNSIHHHHHQQQQQQQQQPQHHHQPHNSNYHYNDQTNFNEFQSSYHPPQFGTAKYPANVLTIAKQKLSELKDDDEQLRQYSLQVLRRPIS